MTDMAQKAIIKSLHDIIYRCETHELDISLCNWLTKLKNEHETNQAEFAKAINYVTLFCLFIPPYTPTDAFSVTDWSELHYPFRFYISATVKQVGLGYMVPVNELEKLFTIGIMLWGLYFYGWRFNGILSAMIMSREDEQLERDDHLSIVQTFCEMEGLPTDDFNKIKFSAAMLWSSHDIFKNAAILKKLCTSDVNRMMSETVQKCIAKQLRLFIDIPEDIQLALSYQLTGLPNT